MGGSNSQHDKETPKVNGKVTGIKLPFHKQASMIKSEKWKLEGSIPGPTVSDIDGCLEKRKIVRQQANKSSAIFVKPLADAQQRGVFSSTLCTDSDGFSHQLTRVL